jgi:hypothetical protein
MPALGNVGPAVSAGNLETWRPVKVLEIGECSLWINTCKPISKHQPPTQNSTIHT